LSFIRLLLGSLLHGFPPLSSSKVPSFHFFVTFSWSISQPKYWSD
jgi:hypothetical protein